MNNKHYMEGLRIIRLIDLNHLIVCISFFAVNLIVTLNVFIIKYILLVIRITFDFPTSYI